MIKIRSVRPEDAERLAEIYRYYVENTAISFEYIAPTTEEFGERIRTYSTKYPYLVAEEDGRIVGYSYAAPFKTRAAYAWSVEATIYLDHTQKGRGIGKVLYTEMEKRLSAQHITNFCACITCPDAPDPYVTDASIRFHTAMGFRMVGKFEKCGRKFGRWYNMVWMEKIISPHLENQPAVTPPLKDIYDI